MPEEFGLFDDLRIVKRLNGRGFVYEIRHCDSGGLEHVLTTCPDAEYAKKLVDELGRLEPTLRSVALGLESLLTIANCIAHSTDEQGASSYATKAHMRAWGHQLVSLIQDLMVVAWDPRDVPSERSGAVR